MTGEIEIELDAADGENGADADGGSVEVLPDLATEGVSRRNLLRTTGSVLAGGSVLTGMTGTGQAAEQGGLNVRTTDVDVLSGGNDAKVRTKGRVGGMSNFDCEQCEVGAHVKPAGGDEWYGGLQTVEHTNRDSFRVGVTLAGLRPGRFKCRLCACPITRDHVWTANIIVIVISGGDEKKHGHDHGHHEKKKKKKKHKKKKYERAYRKTCPCPIHHPDRYHVMFCGGGGRTVLDYAFEASTRNIRRVGVSNAPSVIADRHVTVDTEDYVDGNIVTGAVAGGGDSYVCEGYLTDLRTDDGVSVYINGMEVESDY